MKRIVAPCLLLVPFLLAADGANDAEPAVHYGDRIDPATYGPGIVEPLSTAIARHRAGIGSTDSGEKLAEPGVWVIPSQRGTYYPCSGLHSVINKWGDTQMGIDFGRRVDVLGAYFGGQAGSGVWAEGVRVVGFRDGQQVDETEWNTDIDNELDWFPIDFVEVDRIVIESIPTEADSGGWYSMDDLTFANIQADGMTRDEPTVVDFEDASWGQLLTGTHYAGLYWERGTGTFYRSDAVPPPVSAFDNEEAPAGEGADSETATAGGNGTAPQLLRQFRGVIRGDAGSNSFPPDTCGAIGPNHFVETVNRNFAIYDKFTGQQITNIHLGSFLPGSNGDPRVVFDQYSGRWIVIVTDFSNGQRIYLAFSRTDDPTGLWFKTNFPTDDDEDFGCWPDYPTLGVNETGIYTASYMVGCGMTIFAIDKAPLLGIVPQLGTVTAFRGLPLEGAIQPVQAYGPTPGEYFVSRRSSNLLRVRRLDGPLTSPTLVEQGSISVPGHDFPPDVPSMGGNTALDSVDHRLMNAVYRDGSIWAAHAIGFNGRAACRWYELDPDALSLIQTGTIFDGVFHYFFPGISVNANGDMVIGFSGSHANIFASCYYTGRLAGDTLGETGPVQLLRAGSAPQNNIDGFGRNRWGDYSLTTLDPTDEVTLWTIQEYAHATNIWGTEIAALSFCSCSVQDCEALTSPRLCPFGVGFEAEWNAGPLADALGDVTLTFEGHGDFNPDDHAVAVEINGVPVGDCLPDDCPLGADGSTCAALNELDTGSITISAAEYNNAVNGQDVVVTLLPIGDINAFACRDGACPEECDEVLDNCTEGSPSCVQPECCAAMCDDAVDPPSFVKVKISYDGLSAADCNDDGNLDACEIASDPSLDCNENDRLDSCDIALNISDDVNENGVPDECDECVMDATCDDGLACTENACDAGTCVYTPVDANCAQDGAFCNGPEICDATLGCVSAGDPCTFLTLGCDEVADVCTGDCSCEVQDCSGIRSPKLCPFGADTRQSWNFGDVPVATGDVTLRFEAHADLSLANQRVAINLNGVAIGDCPGDDCVFVNGSDCADLDDLDAEEVVVSAEFFNSAVNGQQAVVEMVAVESWVDSFGCREGGCPAECDEENDFCFDDFPYCIREACCEAMCGDPVDPPSFIIVSLAYQDLIGMDCNGNAELDLCEVVTGAAGDCNANEIPDLCDVPASAGCPQGNCTDDCSADDNQDCVPDECACGGPGNPCAEIIDARSLLVHDDGGPLETELAIDLDEANGVEPRVGGPSKLAFTFSEALDAATVNDANVQVTCVNQTAPPHTASLDNGDTVVVAFDQSLADMDCCTLTFDGVLTVGGGAVDASYVVRPLAGDLDFSTAVTGGDALLIKTHFGEILGIDLSHPKWDYDRSGGVTGGDFALIKPLFGHQAPACP